MLKPILSVNMVTYGRRMKEGIQQYVRQDETLDRVLVENQIGPLALRMKTLTGYGYATLYRERM